MYTSLRALLVIVVGKITKYLGYSKTGGFPKWLISNSKKKIVQQDNKLSYA